MPGTEEKPFQSVHFRLNALPYRNREHKNDTLSKMQHRHYPYSRQKMPLKDCKSALQMQKHALIHLISEDKQAFEDKKRHCFYLKMLI